MQCANDINFSLLILSVGCLAPDGISVKSLQDGRALFLVAESMKTKHSLCSSFQKTSRSLEKQFPSKEVLVLPLLNVHNGQRALVPVLPTIMMANCHFIICNMLETSNTPIRNSFTGKNLVVHKIERLILNTF